MLEKFYILNFFSLILSVISSNSAFSAFDKEETLSCSLPIRSQDTSDLRVDTRRPFIAPLELKNNLPNVLKKMEEAKQISELIPIGYQYLGAERLYGPARTPDSLIEPSNLKTQSEKQLLLRNVKDDLKNKLFNLQSPALRTNTSTRLKMEEKRTFYWGEEVGIKPDEPIEIVHGGGARSLLNFFEKKWRGYKLESNFNKNMTDSMGIQVHPISQKSDDDYRYDCFDRSIRKYADQASKRWDFPAYFTGTIEARYLDVANNTYEAGLRPLFIEKVQNPCIHVIGWEKGEEVKHVEEFAYMFHQMRLYNADQNLISRLIKSNKRRRLDSLNLEIKTSQSFPEESFKPSHLSTLKAL